MLSARSYNLRLFFGWCLNKEEFLSAARDAGLHLVREFVIAEKPEIANAPGACEYWAFLFESKNEPSGETLVQIRDVDLSEPQPVESSTAGAREQLTHPRLSVPSNHDKLLNYQ